MLRWQIAILCVIIYVCGFFAAVLREEWTQFVFTTVASIALGWLMAKAGVSRVITLDLSDDPPGEERERRIMRALKPKDEQ